jgi:predicted  nucleic acid-binding Zn ribbon protein
LNISPNRLHLSKELTSELLLWQHQFDSLYKLWLNSGDQEKQALEQLSSIDSEVNKIGLTLTHKLGQVHQCYYWWFIDKSDENHAKFSACPNCKTDLIKRKNKINIDTYICKQCKIIIAD